VFPEILTKPQQTVLELLSRIAEIRTFYLAGGTALALHLGHRRSQDFDFFRDEDFVPQDLHLRLPAAEDVRVLHEARGTLTVSVRAVPVSFFHYPEPLLRPLQELPSGVPIADGEDIAAMKLAALAGRGSRKDFVDLYVYATRVASLDQVFDRFREKYRRVTVDAYHLLRSLTFFEDAEAEPMPDLLAPITWDQVKSFFRAEATRLFRRL